MANYSFRVSVFDSKDGKNKKRRENLVFLFLVTHPGIEPEFPA